MRYVLSAALLALVLVLLGGCHRGLSLSYGYGSSYPQHGPGYCPPPHQGHGHHGQHYDHH